MSPQPQQQQVGGPVYCPACGRPTPGPHFCDKCGAPLHAPPQAAPPARGSRTGRWLGVWALVLVIAGVAGFAYGFLTGPRGGMSLPTQEQQAVVDAYGSPAAFIVADGPTGPGQDAVRLEQWLYPDTGAVVYFVDGRQVAEDTLTFTEEVGRASLLPWGFGKDMRVEDIEELLGEPGAKIPAVETVFDDYQAYAYENSRLLVGYLDGWLYTVQTY